MKKRIIALFLIIIFTFMFGCSEEEKLNEGTEKVIEAMVTYPNEDLYDPEVLKMPYDAVEERKESTERITRNWSAAVGEYFASNCFNSFLRATPATGILSSAEILNFTERYLIESIELKDILLKETDTVGNEKLTVTIIVNDVDEYSFDVKFTYNDEGLIEFVYIPTPVEFEAILGIE